MCSSMTIPEERARPIRERMIPTVVRSRSEEAYPGGDERKDRVDRAGDLGPDRAPFPVQRIHEDQGGTRAVGRDAASGSARIDARAAGDSRNRVCCDLPDPA